MSTLLITHPACLDHLTPLGHPERPDRLRAIERALEAEKFQTLARSQAPLGLGAAADRRGDGPRARDRLAGASAGGDLTAAEDATRAASPL